MNEQLQDVKLYGKINETMSNIKDQREQYIASQKDAINNMTPGFDLDSHLEDQIKELSIEDIEKLSNEEINKFYTLSNGSPLEINLPDSTEDDISALKRDLLKYKKTLVTEFDNLDNEIQKFNDTFEDKLTDIKESLSKIENPHQAMRDNIVMMRDGAEGRLQKNYSLMLDAFDNGLTLENVYNTLMKLKIRNQFRNYMSEKDNMEKYFRMIDKGVIQPLRNSSGKIVQPLIFESILLPERYHEHVGLFQYLVLNYLWHRRSTAVSYYEGFFFSQIVYNISRAVNNKMTEEEKTGFIKSITNILDLFDEFYTIKNENPNKRAYTITVVNKAVSDADKMFLSESAHPKN
jgi:hypothetical protein